MKKSTSKILLLLFCALLMIADSVGSSTTFRVKIAPGSLPNELNMGGSAVSGFRLSDEVGAFNLRVVRRFAGEYGVDGRLILAMMKQESQFDEQAVSYRGARGLMQIMPVTNDELREELDLGEPMHPRENIQAGIYYFSKLYRLFRSGTEENRMRLALAAYNAGPSRIYDAQELAAYLGENPNDWRSIRHALPLLSKRYYSLHQAVWNENRPPAGYFGSWRETSAYVDAVMKTYERYETMQ